LRSETYELARQFTNVYTDCSALHGWLPSEPDMCRSRLREAVENMPGRVIFGSEWPSFDLAYPYHRWVRFVKEDDWASAKGREEVMGATMRKPLRI